ncbi:MAG: hypothetical protein JWO08_4556 [Verrucomicrobiaceae bacterium]|nr:hypothetical protein [Verrucomicrobiaceae bacterium]
MMDAADVRQLMATTALRGGAEHNVALPGHDNRVLKDLDAHAPATESLFDYLTDILLANRLLGDEIKLEGFYLHEDRLHVLTSQPFVDGVHPDWEVLRSGLENQGMKQEAPRSRIPSFTMDGGPAGIVSVIDLHENNVVVGSETGVLLPIDAHFYFEDRNARLTALRALDLDIL